MGALLAFMFLWNMLGALVLVPALSVFLLKPKRDPVTERQPLPSTMDLPVMEQTSP
jgi:hypothetical protein